LVWRTNRNRCWEEKKPAANRIHTTAKPVELIERALLNSSKTSDVVVAPQKQGG
jgi:DNA modification methylase